MGRVEEDALRRGLETANGVIIELRAKLESEQRKNRDLLRELVHIKRNIPKKEEKVSE